MPINDRKYQLDHIDRIIEEVSTKRKVLAQLPTGGGKTVEFALIAQRYTRNTGKSVLILVHREELLYQAKKTIKSVCDIDACLITSQSKKYYVSRVYIGMIDSLVKRMNLFSDVGLVIIDECHIANFNKVHNIFLEELIIGFTATPISSSKKEPLNKYYSSIIPGPQIKELIALNHLSQNITRAPEDVVDATKLEINKLKGDYDEAAMAKQYKLPKFIINVVKKYETWCIGTKTIIFNVNIEHSKEVNYCLNFCGYNSKHLDSNSTDRKEILEWFNNTDDAILCNVMIATVGFDEPSIRNVILNFATLSLVKFIQCAGRGSRWLPDKNYFNILDMGANYIRFGDWNNDRDWKRVFDNPAKVTEGIAPVKTCPSCEGLVHASLRICPLLNQEGELCNYEFERKKTPEEQDLHEMVLITEGIDVDELIQENRKKYEYYTFLELGHEVVSKLYEKYTDPSDGIKLRAFEAYYELCKEWYSKTLAGVSGNPVDISTSSWHIRRARNNFDSLIQKLKPKEDENKLRDLALNMLEKDFAINKTNGFVPMVKYKQIYGR